MIGLLAVANPEKADRNSFYLRPTCLATVAGRYDLGVLLPTETPSVILSSCDHIRPAN